jgi:hypothetical protein
MRWLLVCTAALGCGPAATQQASEPSYFTMNGPSPMLAPAAAHYDPTQAGTVVDRMVDFSFDGGEIEFEMRRDGGRIIEVARNHYMVPVVMQWTVGDLDNLLPGGPISGVVRLPAADKPHGSGPGVVLTTYDLDDPRAAYRRQLNMHARFGDPEARPQPYAYRLPFKAGKTFSVLQGFHGTFSHRGSNEYAVDFDCPVATPVLAARPGIVVAANAAAQGSGTTPDFLEKVGRGDELALSGNTGFSSTPHLHFQVMTAAGDGISAQSFPFELAVSPKTVETPVQGRAYPSWE